MSVGAWLAVGLVAGFLANLVVGRAGDRQGCLTSIVTGMIGALLGGVVMALVTNKNYRDFINGFNLETVLVASLGAIILIVLVRALSGSARRR